jgi:hypothetical protein
MKNISAAQAATNWAAAMANSSAKMTAGVQAVTEAPSVAAIAAIPRMVQGIQAAAADGRIQRGLQRVTLQAWQQAMINKGITRVATGATNAKPKVQAFMTQFLPFLQQAVATLPPRGDVNQNIQRAVAMMQANAQFKYQPTG